MWQKIKAFFGFAPLDKYEWSRDEFASWVLSKRPDDRYNYYDPSECPIALFLKETGRSTNPTAQVIGWYDGSEGDIIIYPEWLKYGEGVIWNGDWSWGALSDRLYALRR